MSLINTVNGASDPQLCEQVDTFHISYGSLSAILTWTAPIQDMNNSFVGTRVVRKVGAYPTNPNDGVVVYEGTGFTYTDTGLVNGTIYYYRLFAYDAKKKYQNSMRCKSIQAREVTLLPELPVGALVEIEENGVIVPFCVAKHNYESKLNGTGRTLLVRRSCYPEQRKWFEGTMIKYAHYDYDTSDIDKWLNNDYLSLLNSETKNAIYKTSFYITRRLDASYYSDYVTTRPIFLLSSCELGGASKSGYLHGMEGSMLPDVSAIITSYLDDGTTTKYCTRTISHMQSSSYYWQSIAVSKSSNGSTGVSLYMKTSNSYFRPAFTLPSTVALKPEPNATGYYEIIGF